MVARRRTIEIESNAARVAGAWRGSEHGCVGVRVSRQRLYRGHTSTRRARRSLVTPDSAPQPRPASSETAYEGKSARERILDAAARRIVRGGAAALALADVAADAGVSKALIHYHFHDKDRLLEQLVDQLARNVVDRERAALEPYGKQHSPLAVDALWQWLEGELVRG